MLVFATKVCEEDEDDLLVSLSPSSHCKSLVGGGFDSTRRYQRTHDALIFAVYPVFSSPRHDTLFGWWMGGYRLRLPRLGGCGTLSTLDSERTSTYAPFVERLPYTYLHTQIITVRDENVQTSQALDKDFWLGEQKFSNTSDR